MSDVEFEPGQVRTAMVRTSLYLGGKTRPVLLIAPDYAHGSWVVSGITTAPVKLTTDEPRLPIRDTHAAGLDRESYWWGGTNVVPVDQIGRVIGMVSPRDVETLIDAAESLSTDQVCRLWDAVQGFWGGRQGMS